MSNDELHKIDDMITESIDHKIRAISSIFHAMSTIPTSKKQLWVEAEIYLKSNHDHHERQVTFYNYAKSCLKTLKRMKEFSAQWKSFMEIAEIIESIGRELKEWKPPEKHPRARKPRDSGYTQDIQISKLQMLLARLKDTR